MTVINKTNKLDQVLEPLMGEEWYKILKPFFESANGKNLVEGLAYYIKNKVPVYPNFENVFRALKLCPLTETSTVIIGHSPYTGTTLSDTPVANGLAFDSAETKLIFTPTSFRTIVQTVEDSMYSHNIGAFDTDYIGLVKWSNQGVLLLNQSLTTTKDFGSHYFLWANFFKYLIDEIQNNLYGTVFVTFGKYPNVESMIDENLNSFIEAPNPDTELTNDFQNSKIFIEINNVLKETKGRKAMIVW